MWPVQVLISPVRKTLLEARYRKRKDRLCLANSRHLFASSHHRMQKPVLILNLMGLQSRWCKLVVLWSTRFAFCPFSPPNFRLRSTYGFLWHEILHSWASLASFTCSLGMLATFSVSSFPLVSMAVHAFGWKAMTRHIFWWFRLVCHRIWKLGP